MTLTLKLQLLSQALGSGCTFIARRFHPSKAVSHSSLFISFFQSLSFLETAHWRPRVEEAPPKPCYFGGLPAHSPSCSIGWQTLRKCGDTSLAGKCAPNSNNAKRDLWCLFQHLQHVPWRTSLPSKPRSHCFQLCHLFWEPFHVLCFVLSPSEPVQLVQCW